MKSLATLAAVACVLASVAIAVLMTPARHVDALAAGAPALSASVAAAQPISAVPRTSSAAPGPRAEPKPATRPAPDAELQRRVRAAAAYAASHGVRAGVAVLDLRTGACYGAGDYTGLFGSGSVMKVLIAVRLLATGQMHGTVAKLAYEMITRSDDDAANALWPLVGGPDVINQVKAQYHLAFLGTPNTRVGYWGNTHISAKGTVYLYRAILADPKTAKWLYGTMHAAQKLAADGTDQFFGIAAATSNFAIKQGWGTASADDRDDSIVNSTGYVDGGRYAIAILTEGHHNNEEADARGYNTAQASVVTAMARLVLSDGPR